MYPRAHSFYNLSRNALVACKTEKKEKKEKKKNSPKAYPRAQKRHQISVPTGTTKPASVAFFCVRGYNERRLAKVLVPAGTIARPTFVAAGTTRKSGRFSKIFDFATFSITRISMESERVRIAELRLQLCFTANACSHHQGPRRDGLIAVIDSLAASTLLL